MLVKTMHLGRFMTNCHILTDETTRECAVIDPSGECNKIMNYIEDNKLTCKMILVSHGHFDHTGAVEDLHRETGAAVYMHGEEVKKNMLELAKFAPPPGTEMIKEGDKLSLGSLTIEVMETPGHSPGSLTFRCGTALFTGDTLFRDSIGRTDLPGANGRAMLESLKRLATLPGDFDVYPGHMDNTTLERERRSNMFIRQAMDA